MRITLADGTRDWLPVGEVFAESMTWPNNVRRVWGEWGEVGFFVAFRGGHTPPDGFPPEYPRQTLPGEDAGAD